MDIKDIIDELADKIERLEKWKAQDPVYAAYDEGYVDGAKHGLDLLREGFLHCDDCGSSLN